MSNPKFDETHNLVAFLEKPKESNRFEQIIDFLNASSIRYALTVNPTIYTSCIKQFWVTAKVQTVNEEVQIQALVDGKKVIVIETSGHTFISNYDSQALEEVGEGLAVPTDSHHTTTQPSTSRPQKKQRELRSWRRKGDPELTSLEDCTRLVCQNKLKSSDRCLCLGITQEDASKQGRKIADIDQDAEVTLIDETQGRSDDNLMFDISILDEQEVEVEKVVSAADLVTTAGEVVTTVSVEIPKELTLAQTLIEIKSTKPKAVTTAATTTTITRPKARGVAVQEASELTTTTSPSQASQLPQAKDKGKAKIVETEKPLKKKDQIAFDEEVARNLAAQLQAELEEEERLSRKKEEEANIALIESWDNTQAMMDADFQLAQQMQTEEQVQLSIEEKSKLFVELLEKRKKHFVALRDKEKRNKPPTKTQKRNTMSTYLKNMAGYKHNQLKRKSYDEIQEMFDKDMKRVNTFVDMDTELVKGSKTKEEGSSKRAGEELKSNNSKKQKIDEHVEPEGDDDQEEAEIKKHIEIVQDDKVAIDAIPLATKPPVIVEWKIIKEGKTGYYQLIRADGSSKRYSSMIQMLQNIDREDLETLWKLVKAKHENTRPDEAYERVLWGDLKVMFEPDVESEIWRNLQGYKVIVWKLFSSCGVHFVRFQNMNIFMLVEKMYPLTPATITEMLNKKLQTDYWNEMCYQLLKLMTKQGRIVRIKSLLMPLGVNIAKVRVTAVKHNLVLPVKNEENILSSYYCLYTVSAAGTKVNAAGMKVTTAKRLQLLEEFLLTEG
ncbi:hypothetical protein Tco_0135219 [Tanacetum coccineum]